MRVVIAEGQVLLRAGLAWLLADSGHKVVATLGDADSVVEVVDAEQPDLDALGIDSG